MIEIKNQLLEDFIKFKGKIIPFKNVLVGDYKAVWELVGMGWNKKTKKKTARDKQHDLAFCHICEATTKEAHIFNKEVKEGTLLFPMPCLNQFRKNQNPHR